MCTTCGCGGDGATIDGAAHAHGHAPAHPYTPRGRAATGRRRLSLEQDLLAANDAEAAANRRRFSAERVFALNLVSSPGSGKTTLLVETIRRLAGRRAVAVIEGDQQTQLDAERIRASGAPAVQINTGKGCHLDAHTVGHALDRLSLTPGMLLLIENVGNLVCPAAFDLGEAHKVVVLSVTEGEDKPLKYPDMFRAARLLLLNKCDLLPYVNFDVARALANARAVNPDIEAIELSATQGQGMAEWLAWIEREAAAC